MFSALRPIQLRRRTPARSHCWLQPETSTICSNNVHIISTKPNLKPNYLTLTLTLWTWLAPLWTWLRLQPTLGYLPARLIACLKLFTPVVTGCERLCGPRIIRLLAVYLPVPLRGRRPGPAWPLQYCLPGAWSVEAGLPCRVCSIRCMFSCRRSCVEADTQLGDEGVRHRSPTAYHASTLSG